MRLGLLLALSALFALGAPVDGAEAPEPLFAEVIETAEAKALPDGVERRLDVVIARTVATTLRAAGPSLAIDLFDGALVIADRQGFRRNASGSVSWIGRVSTGEAGLVVLVHRAGITVGSIRVGGALYLLLPLGPESATSGRHRLLAIDEESPRFREDEPTTVRPTDDQLAAAERLVAAKKAGTVAEDDGSIQDLMVVYTPKARDAAGGRVAIENLIDLGVTETNLSYEASGIDHRIQLVHVALTDYDETSGAGDGRDLIQDPDDGVMDEVPPLRDLYGADLVKLVYSGGGCGRAFLMNVVSLAHAEFAYCRTDYFCISPGYTFQHELGHVQAARHQYSAPEPDSPFPFNHGYTDPDNDFRTIMAAGSAECPDGCPRRLAWSNPDVLDPETGAPMGIPETEPLPTDNRKTLNATAWTVANFRLGVSVIFADGFESGELSAWTAAESSR